MKLWDDVLSSPECPLLDFGSGPPPRALTDRTLISNGVYVPVLFTMNGGDLTRPEFQFTFDPSASLHSTSYWKFWPLWKRLSISCNRKYEYEVPVDCAFHETYQRMFTRAHCIHADVLTSHVMISVPGSEELLRTPVGLMEGTKRVKENISV